MELRDRYSHAYPASNIYQESLWPWLLFLLVSLSLSIVTHSVIRIYLQDESFPVLSACLLLVLGSSQSTEEFWKQKASRDRYASSPRMWEDHISGAATRALHAHWPASCVNIYRRLLLDPCWAAAADQSRSAYCNLAKPCQVSGFQGLFNR